jgi:hypothetical protein
MANVLVRTARGVSAGYRTVVIGNYQGEVGGQCRPTADQHIIMSGPKCIA